MHLERKSFWKLHFDDMSSAKSAAAVAVKPILKKQGLKKLDEGLHISLPPFSLSSGDLQ